MESLLKEQVVSDVIETMPTQLLTVLKKNNF